MLFGFGIAQAATPQQASDLVKSTTDRLLSELQRRRSEINTNPQAVFDLADRIAVPHFDFELITRYAMGRHWQRASARQRTELVTEFRTLLVCTYAKALRSYSGQQIVLLPTRKSRREDRVLVRSQVKMPSRNAIISIDYRMYAKNGHWKVYDVIIDGVSLVKNYRNEFSQEVRRNGVSGLIRKLQDRNRKC
ncbi:hypothetical protein TI03_04240 [Achromatium sp. WMS1]|nr:hypothetical protein TI03_04240 [Achromatium sp. WMS1]